MLISVIKDISSSVVARVVILVLVTWWLKWLWSRRRFYALSKKLPGPLALPIFGNIIQMGCLADHTKIIPNIKSMKDKYGGFFRIWFGPVFMVCMTEADDFECILTSKLTYNKGFFYDMMKYALHDGLLVSSGAIWKKHRQIINPAFAISTIRKYQSNHNYYSMKLVESMKNVVNKDIVDMGIYSQRYFSDTVCDSLFELKFNCYTGELDDIIVGVNKGAILIHERICKFWLQNDFIFENSSTYQEYANLYKAYSGLFHRTFKVKFQEYVDDLKKNKSIIEKVKSFDNLEADYVLEDSGDVKTKTLINIFAESFLSGDMTMEEILSEFDNIYTPAVDTSYTQLAAFVLMMGMHKRVQDKLWHEIKDFYEHDFDAEVTTDHFSHLPYLDMVFKETMRHFPTGPLQMRRLEEDFYLKSRDITIPAGTQILLLSVFLHKDPKYWKNPNEFYPERFSPEESAKRPHFAYVPFSVGLRNCIGQVFANDSIKTAIIHLMRNYEFSTDASCTLENLPTTVDVSLRSEHGYKVKITNRNRSM